MKRATLSLLLGLICAGCGSKDDADDGPAADTDTDTDTDQDKHQDDKKD